MIYPEIFIVGNKIRHVRWSFSMEITAVGRDRFLYVREDKNLQEFVGTMSDKFYQDPECNLYNVPRQESRERVP